LKRILVLVLSTLLLMPAVVQAARVSPRACWTLAVYLDSDNNLEFWAEKDLYEMMLVGSSEAVNIIVFWDRYSGPAGVYKVLRGGLEELRDCALDGVEPNMGDPATLRSFVAYALKRFPASRFALLCWDHGDDFRGCMYDEHVPAMGFDLLTHQEVSAALSGYKIDVLVYGACVLGTIEVVYEYYASGLDIDYYVANEGYDPMDGFPYDSILTKLVAQPGMASLDLTRMFVDEYIDYYAYGGKAYSQAVTLSVVHVSKVGKVVEDLRSMTEAIMMDMEGYARIVSDARGHANLPWSENGWERLVDLPTFVQTVHDESLDAALVAGTVPTIVASVVTSCETLLGSLSEAILYQRNLHSMERAGCLGMGIYFPTSSETYQRNKEAYEAMRFAWEGWLNFLNTYWAVES